MADALPAGARPCTQERSQHLFVDDKSILPNPLPRETFEATLDAADALQGDAPRKGFVRVEEFSFDRFMDTPFGRYYDRPRR